MLFAIAFLAGSALPSFDELWDRTAEDVLASFSTAVREDGAVTSDFVVDGAIVTTRFLVQDQSISGMHARAVFRDRTLTDQVCDEMRTLVEEWSGPGERRSIREQDRYEWTTKSSDIVLWCGPFESVFGSEFEIILHA